MHEKGYEVTPYSIGTRENGNEVPMLTSQAVCGGEPSLLCEIGFARFLNLDGESSSLCVD